MNYVKTMVTIDLEESTSKGDHHDLKDDDNQNDKTEKTAFFKASKKTDLIFNFATADEIEDLKEDKGVEDKSQMPTVVMVLFKPFLVIVFTSDSVESSIGNGSLAYSIVILSF